MNIDYHVEYDHDYYSVPHALVHEQVDVRATATTVEIFLRGQARRVELSRFRARLRSRPAPSVPSGALLE